ncbi:MAG: NADH pyrophosphatase zinc ribbon domain-containing protein [Bacteroidales bacterium]|nr:NADH pyrophosphatase zinc ribbon domain-containing protein [Bacteroidales bacterium]
MIRWFVFYNDRLLVRFSDGTWHVPCCENEPVKVPVGCTLHSIGVLDGMECRSFSLMGTVSDSETQQMVQLRASYDILSLQEYNMAGKAFEILNWDRNYRYCPTCGAPLRQISAIGKKCPECRQEFYPNLAPAIIVRVQKEDKILLTSSMRHPN